MNEKNNAVYWQGQCIIASKPRGFHQITEEIKQALIPMPPVRVGLLHLFLLHTSASLAISENTCVDVAIDLEIYFNTTVPEDNKRYRHTIEGDDDMPAHIKNAMLGVSLIIPLNESHLILGQWQGIYLCEHRNHATARQIVLTVHGT